MNGLVVQVHDAVRRKPIGDSTGGGSGHCLARALELNNLLLPLESFNCFPDGISDWKDI